MSLENGMIVNQDKHDAQCQEQDLIKCSLCGDEFHKHQISECGKDNVCEFCEREYCLQQVDCIASYIENNLDFLKWWFDSLPKDEQIDLLGKHYKQSKADETYYGRENKYTELEKDFCVDSDSFFDYVRGQMNA